MEVTASGRYPPETPPGQLAGFAKQDDLPFFLDRLADGCSYVHLPDLAPSDEILDYYRDKKDWASYETQFQALMDQRNIPAALERKDSRDR